MGSFLSCEYETDSFVYTLKQMLAKAKRNNYFRKWNRGDERTENQGRTKTPRSATE